MDKKLVMLAILDGWGINEREDGNAITLAKTPNLDSIMKQNPSTIIHTSGLNVGLPDGQMGTSEVGHMNIGAGRIVYQDLAKITKSIQDGDFFQNEAFLKAVENLREALNGLQIGITTDAINVSVDCAIEELSVLTGEKATETVVNEVFKK